MTEDAAVAALMSSFDGPKGSEAGEPADDQDDDVPADDDQDADVPAGDPADDADDDDQGDPADDDAPDPEDGEGDDQPPAVAEAADDAVVRFTVNGETQEVTVASLKRLAGQEAALTRKSQEADAVGGRAAAALQAAIEAVGEDLQPYADVDWPVLQQEVSPEEFRWHRENYSRVQKRYEGLVAQAQGFEQAVSQRKQADTLRRAQETNQVLSDPQSGIPGWGNELYGDILDFAVGAGLPEADVSNIVDPTVIRLLHKAMLYDRGAKATAAKVKAAPTKVLKPGNRDGGAAATGTMDVRKATQRLARSGSDDDAVALLKGRWG
jgi:hypothetical protein